MRTPSIARRGAALGVWLGASIMVASAGLTGCSDPNTGVDPPRDEFFFPAGLLLDPRTPPGESARYLFVSNGNNDLSFNAGSLAVVDLDAFFAAWQADPTTNTSGELEPSFEAYRFCDGDRCVLDVGSQTTEDFPCRRLGFLPGVVECDERTFVVDGVRVGDFATVLAASQEAEMPRLWVPVRGDPSVTFIDIAGEYPAPPDLRCGQAMRDGEADDTSRCSDDFKLTHVRNDESLDEIAREPFNIHISEGDGYRYGLVAHAAGSGITLIDLDGLRGSSKPAIVDAAGLFIPAGGGRTGGFGLTTRPCGACGAEGEDNEISPNTPTVTEGCTRPLFYAGFRFQLSAVSLTAGGLDFAEMPAGATTRDSCFDDAGNYLGPYCAEPDEIGEPCAVICEPTFQNAQRFLVGGVDPLAPTLSAALGDVAFGDPCGDDLYLIQTNPGALLKLDTSLGPDDVPLDIPSGPPIELCSQPTRLEIWHEEGLAFASCFQAGYVYIVDLRASTVVGTIISGTGPHDLVLDKVRQVLYVANSLEESISVVDVGRTRPTRYTEVARIGLQEPFSQ